MNGRGGGYGGYSPGGTRDRFEGGGPTRNREPAGPDPAMEHALSRVRLSSPSVELFDTTAKEIADILQQPSDRNKSSQLRRFYDEIIRFSDQHRPGLANEALFSRDLPFIRMIAAHAAYAQNRKHVDANFTAFIQQGVRQVNNAQDLAMLRTLFEAVIGFMPKKD